MQTNDWLYINWEYENLVWFELDYTLIEYTDLISIMSINIWQFTSVAAECYLNILTTDL